ncbi:MAG: hypothetical protein Q8N48_06210 [Thiobacillus sp.]|jgi:hypothetical protein|nr:hypothetical protein [Thiobacillus sp.]MDP2978405.1 hypothetical protein [Thiobacillus sp.]
MAQLHCYVPEEIARQAQRRATQSGLSLSRYLAELVKRDATSAADWPEGYFDLFGKWEGAPLERLPQGEFEERLTLK